MRIERVVVDASPLIALFKSGLADLLPGLFTEVIVPMPVRHEVLAQGQLDAATAGLANMTDAGCWLSPDLVRAALMEAAEV